MLKLRTRRKTVSNRRICLGKIAAAHGIRGLVKIIPFGDDASLLNGEVFREDGTPLVVSLKNKSGKYILAAIDGVNDRDGAEALRGAELFVDRESLPETDEGQHYIEDLVGLSVVEDGAEIGTVLAVKNYGASDLLDIRLASGETFYLPVTDDYVMEIGEVITVKNHKDVILG